MLSDREKQEVLGNLIIDNQDLDFLESTLSEFNIFEAIGVVRQEIRHSNVIAFLLNPQETHRLSDLFLKKLLICALLKSENPTLSPIGIDIANLENVEIRREWKNIDILIYSPMNQFVCVIENKVDSSEHSDQLKRYEAIIDGEFPEYHKLFIYLTKGGYSASRQKWLSLSYEEVVNEIESICNKYRSTMSNDVYTLISHYVSLVRRHIPFQKTCDSWTQSNRLLLFEFVNEPQYLGLHLVIGPSDKTTKQHIFETIRKLDIHGHVSSRLSEKRCSHINRREILNSSDYLDGDLEIAKEKIQSFWKKYLNHEIKLICLAIRDASWVELLKD
jgi:PD-(D/E)XK nuclease superfamily